MKFTREHLHRFTPAQVIVFYYFLAIGFSFLLLNLPGVYLPGVEVSFIDSLFTAVSAVSVTGLTSISISGTYSVFGLCMLMLVLQLGGIGIMSIGTFFWLLVKKRIGLRERQLIMVDHNQYSLAGVVDLIKQIVLIIVMIEIMGGIILTMYLMRYYDSFREALLNGMFMSVSATTNSGFDINRLFYASLFQRLFRTNRFNDTYHTRCNRFSGAHRSEKLLLEKRYRISGFLFSRKLRPSRLDYCSFGERCSFLFWSHSTPLKDLLGMKRFLLPYSTRYLPGLPD